MSCVSIFYFNWIELTVRSSIGPTSIFTAIWTTIPFFSCRTMGKFMVSLHLSHCYTWIQCYSGFTIALYEFQATIPTLWDTVKSSCSIYSVSNLSLNTTSYCSLADFTRYHPNYIDPNNALNFISDDDGESYNMCHCMCVWKTTWGDPKAHFQMCILKFGATSRSQTWISGAAMPTRHTLIISTGQGGFTTRYFPASHPHIHR